MKGSAALRKEVDAGDCWRGFQPGDWRTSINVRDFIVRNVSPFSGSEEFMTAPSQRTKAVWAKLQPYFAEERKRGVLAVDAQSPSTLLAHKAGYIDRNKTEYRRLRNEYEAMMEEVFERTSSYFSYASRNLERLNEVAARVKKHAIEPSFELLAETRASLEDVKNQIRSVEFHA